MAAEPWLRRFLLASAVATYLAAAVELILVDHYEEWQQVLPFVMIAVGLAAAGWAWASPAGLSLRSARWAGVFATITGVSRALLAELGDPEGASNIGALIPFFMMVLMAKGFIIATPFLVRAISGNIMMPALSAGFCWGFLG